MNAMMISLAALLFFFRVRLLQRLWRLPLKNGEGFFLASPVGPDFYRTAGAPLFRRYQLLLFFPLVLDVPLVAWFAFTERFIALALEQLLAMLVAIVLYNLMVAHFSTRAAAVSGVQEERPASIQLSMTPRRLRDYLVPAVEAVIVVASVLALALLAYSYALSRPPGATHSAVRAFRGGLVLTVWVFYWQIGFLLLKGVFVRWRMPLPANRTEDFRRWRAAWLSHNLRVFDAVRLLSALSLLAGMTWINYGRHWPRMVQIAILLVAALGMLVYTVYVMRESRRLAATERELRPVEMVKEFPRWPVAEGRYLAGGLLYFNRDNPWVVVRSAQGIALNLAHRTVYAWTAYFTGLIALVIWMARLAH
jgi:hypothetical protein